ncbi:MAG: nuclear transport factor 2 family protein [Cyclobacteriaceae bacterium]
MTYLEQEQQLQSEASGDLLAAFEKYYHEDVVMEEPSFGKTEGKQANREREKSFAGMIKDFHGGGLKSISANEEEATTATESWMEATFQDGNRVKMEQVSIKKWEGDKVIHERFYYNAG